MISTPNKPRKMAIQVLASTFSRKKIRAPKTTNKGADCKIAVAEDMGVKAMAKAAMDAIIQPIPRKFSCRKGLRSN